MQLRMVAPLDIGLEQHDASLDLGQDDIFDLSTTMRKKKVAQLLAGSDGDIGDSSEADSEASDGEDEPDVEYLDSEDEKETKIKHLEDDLDGMYDAYQDRLQERDAKFKARSLRQQKEGREEWNGIREKDSDDEDTDEEQSEDGGWSAMEEAKVALDHDSDDSEEDDPVESNVQKGKKRALPLDPSSAALKRPRLLTDRDGPKPGDSHATKLWFSRDVFAGEGDLEVESDEDENQESHDSGQSYMDERTNVALSFSCRYDVLTIRSFSRIPVITISK
jgi:AdoMet-dependent rRNA methyltransferase SPB1